MTANQFIHIRVHSCYSLLESTIQPDDLISFCSKNNIPAVGLTDTGNLFGALEFAMLAQKKKIQGIHGCIFKFDPELKNEVLDEHNRDEILLIAKNKIGYKNLLKLSREYYAGPTVLKFAQLEKFKDGLIALTSGVKGTIGRLLLDNKPTEAEVFLEKLNATFNNHLYIELMRNGLETQQKTEKPFIDFGLKHNIPFIATNDVYFLDKSMHEAQDALMCIADGRYVVEENRRRISEEHYFKSTKEMCDLFSDIPEATQNTIALADRCSYMAESHQVAFPDYQVTIGRDEEDELEIFSHEGLLTRFKEINYEINEQQYKERLLYELEVLKKMGFASYFLIVSDFIRWAKSNGIPVGPGRGSGAGSLVSWCLAITDVDPIRFGLLFERFLNPERVSLPDLDIDFCQERRDEVINYVRDKYGNSRVAHILTFGKLQARAVLRDVGRVLQVPYMQVDRIAKMVPFNAVNPVTLSMAIEMEPELQKAYESDEAIKKLLDVSLKLEGLPRHVSIHAAGIVISKDNLEESIPLYKSAENGMPVIQYSMKYAESAGLVKFDFLGLKTLTIIENTQKLIRKTHPNFDISKVSFDDRNVFAMLALGRTVGVFQIESAGMRDVLTKMHADSIEDIIALGALYRPGPMDNIPSYINGKLGKIKPDYLHPKIEHILKKTFGVIVYQEQVMEIAQVLAGYSLGEADLLRRAMGKKIKAEMAAQKNKFVKGAVARGLPNSQATYLFDLIAKFAGYGFNRSHAVAYGIISYNTAYLKANFPVEFLTSQLNSEIDDTDKINTFIEEAKKSNIEIALPNVNTSEAYFVAGDNKIHYGLGAIKNVGLSAMQYLCEVRAQKGEFQTMQDFITKLDSKVINKRQLEFLIKSGALDCLECNRKAAFDNIENFLSDHSHNSSNSSHEQLSLFAPQDNINKEKRTEDWDKNTKLDFECSALGFYLSGHPLQDFQSYFYHSKILDASNIASLKFGNSRVLIAAIPVTVKTRSSPRGRYIILAASTAQGMLSITVFDDEILKQHRTAIYSKAPLIIQADVRKDGDVERITATKIQTLESYLQTHQLITSISVSNQDAVKHIGKLIKQNEKLSALILLKIVSDIECITIEVKNSVLDADDAQVINTIDGIIKIRHEVVTLERVT